MQEEKLQEKEDEKEEATNPPRRRTARKVWVRKWFARRHKFGQYDKLLTELSDEDPRGYKNYIRIIPDLFQEMVEKLTPNLQKQSIFVRELLQAELKLATTFRFLATGNSYARCSVASGLSQVRSASLYLRCVRPPSRSTRTKCSAAPTGEEWKDVVAKFSSIWSYHNYLGALDGKHVAMKKPPPADF